MLVHVKSRLVQIIIITITTIALPTVLCTAANTSEMHLICHAKNAQGQDVPFKVTIDGDGASWQQIQSANPK